MLSEIFSPVGALKSIRCAVNLVSRLILERCKAVPDLWQNLISKTPTPSEFCRVVTEKDTGISKGYAFCAYYELANAESAIRNLSNREINGRPIRLGYAQDYAFRYEDQGGSKGRQPW